MSDNDTCSHGWRGSTPENGKRIADRCLTCGSVSVFIGSGGWLTCAHLGCGEPGIGKAIDDLCTRAELAEARVVELEDPTQRTCANCSYWTLLEWSKGWLPNDREGNCVAVRDSGIGVVTDSDAFVTLEFNATFGCNQFEKRKDEKL